MITVINKHVIVSVTNNTTDAILICPYKKFINWSINDKLFKLSTKYGTHVAANTKANVIIPEIIGDSVRLDASIPNDMNVIESSKNPKTVVKYIGTFGISKKHNIPKYISVHITGININKNADKNFAITTPNMLTGDVNKSWSVPDFLSPENDHIVISGIINISPYNAV